MRLDVFACLVELVGHVELATNHTDPGDLSQIRVSIVLSKVEATLVPKAVERALLENCTLRGWGMKRLYAQ